MPSREDILGFDDLTREPVVIPEWGGITVWVRVMRAAERDWLDAMSLDAEGQALPIQERLQDYRGRVTAITSCNEDGSSIFMLTDAAALGKKSARAIDRIVEVAQRINRMTEEEVNKLTGNSVEIPGGASS